MIRASIPGRKVEMLRIAVLGCGRIGQMHAANVARHPRAKLATVYDVHAPSAERVAAAHAASAGPLRLWGSGVLFLGS